MPEPAAVLFDIDGTLVDSNYLHAVTWHRAFREVDADVPIWRIHRSIGMDGDELLRTLAPALQHGRTFGRYKLSRTWVSSFSRFGLNPDIEKMGYQHHPAADIPA